MAKTFRQMVSEARETVGVISPQDAQQQIAANSGTVVVDVRQPDDIASTGKIPGAINVPLGLLAIRADQELPEHYREALLQDRNTPVITTCGPGGQGALGAKVLHDMGFTNVKILDGGTVGWKNAGLPTE